MNKTIIYGGSFDPVHLGHLQVAESALHEVGADKVVFVLAKHPRWKDEKNNELDRLRMLELFLKDVTWAEISHMELDSPAPVNYSADTVRDYQNQHPNETLFFLLGADQANKFHNWYKNTELIERAAVLVYERPGIPLNLDNVITYKMQVVPGPKSPTSSSLIRELKSADTSLEVLEYIASHNLYYLPKIKEFISGDRLAHSLEVAKLAKQIAEANNLSGSDAYVAGLLHDIGKNISESFQKEIMQKKYAGYVNLNKWLHHQFVSEYLAREVFGIKSRTILEAIRKHATGDQNMGPIAMVTYSADKIEPTRGFDSSGLIAACMNNYQTGFLKVLAANREYLLANEKDIYNKLTKRCFRQYLKEKK
jgi:nicotinate-nucleotide adenylyltransferase